MVQFRTPSVVEEEEFVSLNFQALEVVEDKGYLEMAEEVVDMRLLVKEEVVEDMCLLVKEKVGDMCLLVMEEVEVWMKYCLVRLENT